MAEAKTETTEDTTVQKNQTRPSNLCCYSQRICNLEKLKGFDFCHKHILEDKASPFKPCDFYAKINDKRCMNPAPKMPDNQKSYCLIHTRKAELRRAVEKRKKKRQREHSGTVEGDGEGSGFGKRRRTSSSASQKSLDGSQRDDEAPSSDEELSTDLGAGGSLKVDSAWHGDIDSDAESVDSEEEDYLRHAGTWTVDEVSKMCVDKMTRLKSLYMAQYKRLFHVLKEKRRKYLQLIQAEQENEGERHASPSEILGTSSHSKRHGVEAILHKQAKEKRHGISSRHQNSTHQRCTHVSDGMRCSNKILPLTKFCIHHISHDPNQLLFQNCSFKTGDNKTCSNVIPKVFTYSTCQLHVRLTAEPMRSNVESDLQEAAKRDLERKVGEESLKDVKSILKPFPDVSEMAMQDKQLPIPKALQQKSSALIPPLAPASTPSNASNTPETPHLARDTVVFKPKHPIPNLKLEKMDVESAAVEQPQKIGSSESTPMELMSPASGTSTPAGIKSISPTLLAASLVAVCSATSSPSVTSAPATSTSDLTKESVGITSTALLEVPPSSVVASASLPVSGVATTESSAAQCTVTSTSTSIIPSEPKTSTLLSTSVTAATESSVVTSTSTAVIQSEPNTVTSTATSITPSELRSSNPCSTSMPLETNTIISTGSSTLTSSSTGVVSSEPTTVTSSSTTAILSEPCTVSSDGQNEVLAEKIPKITAATISKASTNKMVDLSADVSKTSGENKCTTEENKTQVIPCTNSSSTVTSVTSREAAATSSSTSSTGTLTTSQASSPLDINKEAVKEDCDKSDKKMDA